MYKNHANVSREFANQEQGTKNDNTVLNFAMTPSQKLKPRYLIIKVAIYFDFPTGMDHRPKNDQLYLYVIRTVVIHT